MKKTSILFALAFFTFTSVSEAYVADNKLGRKIDFAQIVQLTKLKEEDVLKFIQKEGVVIYKVPSTDKKAAFLKHIPYATKVDLERVGIPEKTVPGEAEYKSPLDRSNQLQKPVMVLSESIESITLLHEYMHHIAFTQLPEDYKQISADIVLAAYQNFLNFSIAANTFATNKEKYYSIPKNVNEYIKLLLDLSQDARFALHFRASEEIMIEYSLRQIITKDNRYYDEGRLSAGSAYARKVYQDYRSRNRFYRLTLTTLSEHVKYLVDFQNQKITDFDMKSIEEIDKILSQLNSNSLVLKPFTEYEEK